MAELAEKYVRNSRPPEWSLRALNTVINIFMNSGVNIQREITEILLLD